MTWHALDCGIHEARRELEACPVCEHVLVSIEAMPAPSSMAVRAQRAQRERRELREQEEAEMVSASKYTSEQQANAVRRRTAGESAAKIAQELGCSPTLIWLWVKRANGAPKASKPATAAKPASKPSTAPRRSTVADPGNPSHEDVIAFLAKLPPMPWAVGDAIRLLAFSAIDGDLEDVVHAHQRIGAHLAAVSA